MAPVEGAINGMRAGASSGMMAWVCGVPRFRNSATTPWSISALALSAARAGSNLSSSEISSMRCPLTPPALFTASISRRAPSVVSFTPAATGPVKPAVWPTRIGAWAQAVPDIPARLKTRPQAQRCKWFMVSPELQALGGGRTLPVQPRTACPRRPNRLPGGRPAV